MFFLGVNHPFWTRITFHLASIHGLFSLEVVIFWSGPCYASPDRSRCGNQSFFPTCCSSSSASSSFSSTMSASTSTSTSALPTLRQALRQLPSSVRTAGPQPETIPAQCAPLDLNLGPSQLSAHHWTSTFPAQCAPLDLNLGPSQLSAHRWTSTWDLPSSMRTAGPQRPDRMPEEMPDRMPEDMPDKMP